jgi:four helix bundle protein
MSRSIVLDKSLIFALRIVRLSRYLIEEKKEYVLSRELLISGTHIGKHIKEAVNAESRQSFVHEMGVARRKASETEYWLQLLHQGDYLSDKEFASIETDRAELFKLLTSIVKTSKENE